MYYEPLERITDSKIKSRILPLEIVNPALARELIWIVKLNTPVETQDDKLDVNTQTQTAV